MWLKNRYLKSKQKKIAEKINLNNTLAFCMNPAHAEIPLKNYYILIFRRLQ